jgi:cytochrome P450
VGKFHPLQPAYLADPYPYLARLRETEPVLYSPDLQGYVLTRYRDCAAVLRDDVHFSSDPGLESGGLGESVRKARACAPLGETAILANSDGPVHMRLRAVLAEAFRARSVIAWREPFQEIASSLVDGIEPGRPSDVMKLIAEPLPVIVLLEFLGIPTAERDTFRRCVVAIMRGRMDGDRAPQAVLEAQKATQELRTCVAERCSGAPGSVVSTLNAAVENGDLSGDEMLMLLVHVATAGNAATAFAIGNALLAFANHPTAWAHLRNNLQLIPSAIEECLRFDSPTHITTRFALQDAEVDGRRIPRGRAVHLVISAANRDPDAFPDPDCFDIARKQERQAAFGLGAHFCLGATLGRLEMEMALSTLLERVATLDLAPNGYEPGGTLHLRGPRKLLLVGS